MSTKEDSGGVQEGTPDIPLHVETHGLKGPTLLLLHGFGLSGYLWRHWVPRLSESHRVVVVDMKGSGRAPRPKDRQYGPHHQAALVHRLVEAENLEELTLVGHSIGGAVALLTALQLLEHEPCRLRRLVLVAGAAFPQPIPPYIRKASLPFIGRVLLQLVPARIIVREALRLAYFDPGRISAETIPAYAEPIRRRGGRYALSWAARQLLPPDLDSLTSRYPEIPVPTLLLWGSHDPVVPLWVGRKLERTLPSVRLEILQNCGHMAPEELPEESLESVMGFLAEDH